MDLAHDVLCGNRLVTMTSTKVVESGIEHSLSHRKKLYGPSLTIKTSDAVKVVKGCHRRCLRLPICMAFQTHQTRQIRRSRQKC